MAVKLFNHDNALKPGRQAGESFEQYKARRAYENRAVKVCRTWGGREAIAQQAADRRNLETERERYRRRKAEEQAGVQENATPSP